MSDSFQYSVESVIFFLVVLFLAFCCGLLRGLRQYFNRTNATSPSQIPEGILVTHIRLQRNSVDNRHDDGMHSVYPGGGDPPSPPPYSVVSNDTTFMANVPPPSYDDVIKQYQPTVNTAPKTANTDGTPC